MGVERLRVFLSHHYRVALDTSIFIYHLEANPKYVLLTDCVFGWLDRQTSTAVTSIITMTELLVKPYRESDRPRVDKCFALLSTYPHLEWISPTLEISARAAEIRAMQRLRTPDALQAGTALQANATAMLSNDPVFRRLSGIQAVMLDEYI